MLRDQRRSYLAGRWTALRGLPPLRPLRRAAAALAGLVVRPSRAPSPTNRTRVFRRGALASVPQDDDIGLSARQLANVPERVQMRCNRLPDRALRSRKRISRRVDARESSHPRAPRAIRFVLDHDRRVLGHSPASFKMRCARPVPTSFLVCTDTVMTFSVVGWMNWRWLPFPTRCSTKPASCPSPEAPGSVNYTGERECGRDRSPLRVKRLPKPPSRLPGTRGALCLPLAAGATRSATRTPARSLPRGNWPFRKVVDGLGRKPNLTLRLNESKRLARPAGREPATPGYKETQP